MKRILIVGGGVAGLGAAYKVARAASEGHEVEFVLFEKDPRLGGKIQTEIVRDASEDKFIVDGGPDCFLTEKPACHRIAKLLGIFDDELPTDESRKRTWILSRGKLHQMPDGIFMFAPTKFLPFATTGLFSWPGKIRMAMDLFIPPKKVVPGELNDETLESFVVRRMGRECLERLAEPLVGGVHASDSVEDVTGRDLPAPPRNGTDVWLPHKGLHRSPSEGRRDAAQVPATTRPETSDLLHLVCQRDARAHGPHGRRCRS